ncbi:MAG: ketoacyl-ACP synthase III [Candidatus Bruticola sp.]
MNNKLEKPIIIVDAAKAFPVDDLPGAILTNEKLSELMLQVKNNLLHSTCPRHIEISDVDFPFDRIGIRSRRILDCLFGVYDIAAAASQKIILKRSDLENLRLIVTATITADRVVPCVSASVQDALKLPNNVQVLDVRVGCSGYVSALEMTARLMQSYPPGSLALVIGADCMSRVLDASDRGTCVIFGDGGGAALLAVADRTNEETHPVSTYKNPWRLVSAATYTDGSKGDLITVSSENNKDQTVYRFVARDGQVCVEPDELSKLTVFMDGRSVYKDMVRLVPRKIVEHLQEHNLSVNDIDRFLFHQANGRMIEAICKRLNIPDHKVQSNIESCGNTTNGCIPSLLASEIEHDSSKAKRAVIVAFGTGYSLSVIYMERLNSVNLTEGSQQHE